MELIIYPSPLSILSIAAFDDASDVASAAA
jgi:hypothetical protein